MRQSVFRQLAVATAFAAAAGCIDYEHVVPTITGVGRDGDSTAAALPVLVCNTPQDPIPSLTIHRGIVVFGTGFRTEIVDATDDSGGLKGPQIVYSNASVAATTFSYGNDAAIGVDVFAVPAGLYDVTAVNPGGYRSNTLRGAVDAEPPPTITQIEPATLCASSTQTQTFRIHGANFGASVPVIQLTTYGSFITPGTAVPSSQITVDSSTQISVTVPAGYFYYNGASLSLLLLAQNQCYVISLNAIQVTGC